MQYNQKSANRPNFKLLAYAVLFQQISGGSAAMANGFNGYNGFSGHMPVSPNNLMFHQNAANFAHPTNFFAGGHPAPTANFSQAGRMLPPSFGMGVSSLPQTPQITLEALPLARTTHINNAFSAALHARSGHNLQLAHNMQLLQRANAQLQPQTVQLDLTSSNTFTLNATAIKHGDAVSINVGGNTIAYHAGDKVTAAELVAIEQAQSKNGQTIQVDTSGRANGGTFSLNSVSGGAGGVIVASVVVPANVTAVDRVTLNNKISLSSDLINYGSIQEIGRSNGGSSNISALDIINEPGASITGKGGGRAGLELNLTAQQDFTNLGVITSTGNLNVLAGAGLSDNTRAANMLNSGIITSTNGNVTLSSAVDRTLNINNTGGTISAVRGAINVREVGYAGASDTNIAGGNLLSQQLNLNAGGGTTNVNVQELTGKVNAIGNAVHVNAETKNLVLGVQKLSGDPTYYNDNGDITLDGDIVVNESLVIAASGNVTSTANTTTIQASDGSGHGRDITIVAGANITATGNDPTTGIPTLTPTTGGISVNGGSQSGGDIDFSKSPSSFTIVSKSTADIAAGGNVTLAAYTGTQLNGRVVLPDASIIDASGSNGHTGGDVTILAGCNAGPAPAIQMGGITNARNITIAAVEPFTSNNKTITFDANGKITSGNTFVRDYSGQSFGAFEDVKISAPITSGGYVVIAGANDLLNSSISATDGMKITASDPNGSLSIGGSLSAGQRGITLVSAGSIFTIGSNTINISTENAISGGNITMIAGAAFTETATSVILTGHSGNGSFADGGGNILLDSNPISQLSSKGTSTNANGGNITLVALDSLGPSTFEGVIRIPGTITVTSGGGANATSGDITFVSGLVGSGTSSFGIGDSTTSINIDTAGGLAGTGNVTLSMNTPTFAKSITIDNFAAANQATFLTGPLLQSNNNTSVNTNQALSTLRLGFGYFADPAFATNSNYVFESGDTIATKAFNVPNSVTLIAANLVRLDNTIAASGGITLVSGGNVVTNVTGVSLKTGSSTGSSGNILIAAGAAYSELNGVVTITGPSATGGSIDFNTVPISKIETLAFSAPSGSRGGDITMLAFDAASGGTGKVALPTSLLVTTGGNGAPSGHVTVVAGAASGTAISLGSIVTMGLGTASSGAVTLMAATPNTSNPLVYDITGNLVSGTPIPAKNTVNAADIEANLIASEGGSVTVASGANLRISSIDVSGNASLADGSGNGGTVVIYDGSNTDMLKLGVTTGNNFIGAINAASDINTSGNGGTVEIHQTGTAGIQLTDFSNITYKPLAPGAVLGGSLTLDAGKGVLDLDATDELDSSDSSTAPAQFGGAISISGSDISSKSTLSIFLSADGTTQGGSVSVNYTGSQAQKIGFSQDQFELSANGGGGIVSFKADNAALSVDTAALHISNGGHDGASVILEAKGITAVTGPLVINADGALIAKGGSISVTDLANEAVTVGGGSTNYQFSARGGLAGGSITVVSQGNLTVDPTFLDASPYTTQGDGPSYTLQSGANLFVSKGLSATSGLGQGGSITLISNSKTPFTIGFGAKVNGVNGSVDVTGDTLFLGNTGSIFVENRAGGIANNVSGAALSAGTFTEHANGDITAKSLLVGSANIIDLSTVNKGKIAISTELIGNLVVLSSDSAPITAVTFANSVQASTAGAVKITSDTTNVVNFQDISGSTITLNAERGIAIAGTIQSPGAIVIASTGKSTSKLPVTANLDMMPGATVTSSSTIKMSTQDQITLNGMINGTAGVTITNNGTTSTGGIAINDTNITAGLKGSVSLIAANSITSGLSSMINAGGTVTLTGTKDAVVVPAVGTNVYSPTTISIKSAKEIDLNGPIIFNSTLTGIVTNKTTGQGDIKAFSTIKGLAVSHITLTAGNFGKISDDPSNLNTTMEGGIIAIKAGSDISFTNTSITADKGTASLTSTSGAVTIDSVADVVSHGAGVTLIAAGQLSVNGLISAVANVVLTSQTGNVTTGVADIDSLTTVSINALRGALTMNATIGNVLVPKSVNLDALDNLTVTGNINYTTGALAVTTLDKLNVANVSLEGNINGSGLTSTLAVNTGAKGQILDGASLHQINAGTITLSGDAGITLNNSNITAKTGNAELQSVGAFLQVGAATGITSSAKSVEMTASGDVAVDGKVSGATSVSIITKNAIASVATVNVGVSGNITTTSPAGIVGITATGDVKNHGTISSALQTAVTSKTGVLVSDGGSKLSSTAGNLQLTSGDNLDLEGTTSAVSYIKASSGRDVTLGDVTATNGYISFIGNGNVKTLAGTTISAMSVNNAQKSTIVLQTKNITNGVIEVDGNMSTQGKNGGAITIAISSSAAAAKNPTTDLGANITISDNNGIVYAGLTPSAIIGVGPTSAQLNTKNANIVLSSPKATDTISFGSGAIISADPPYATAAANKANQNAVGMALPILMPVAITSPLTAGVTATTTTAVNSLSAGLISAAALNSDSALNNAGLIMAGVTGSQAAIYQATYQASEERGAIVYNVDKPLQGSVYQSQQWPSTYWISDTEIAGGQIPATLLTDSNFSLDAKAACDYSCSKTGHTRLSHGTLISAPKVDNVIKTALGDVHVKARSLVMIMAYHQGLAVYNLHDTSKSSVFVEVAGSKISIAPGQALIVHSGPHDYFEMVNPAQLVCYGKISQFNLAPGLRAFHAEFSPATAINAVPALRQIVSCNHPQAKRISSDLLKTTSILMEITGGMNHYRQMRRPEMTASSI
jgi:filamentous hemagglutinin